MSVWKWDTSKTDFEVDKSAVNKFKDITGNRYGKLVAEYPIRIKKKAYWHCKCDCGNEINIVRMSLDRGITKSCGCIRKEVTAAKNRAGFKGCGDISGNKFGNIRSNAKIRNLEFDITVEYVWNLFLKQDRKCKFTGIELSFGNKGYKNTTASLDRIDSSKGYIEGNVQWVHKTINSMKKDMTDDEFVKWCKLVIYHNGG